MNPEQKPYSPDQPAENFGRKAAAQTECTPLESALVYQKYEEIRCVAVRDYRIRRPLTLRLVPLKSVGEGLNELMVHKR